MTMLKRSVRTAQPSLPVGDHRSRLVPSPAFLLHSLALACALSAPVSSDIVVLRNGNEIQGEVIKVDDHQVIVKFAGGILQLRLKDVKEIQRQDRDLYLLEEGDKQARRGDYAAAVETYSEALRENSASDRARKGIFTARKLLARSLSEIGRYREARSLIEELLRERPHSSELRKELSSMEKIVQDAQAEEVRAIAQLRSGYVDGALWRLQKIYDRFPDRREEVGSHLADAMARKGDFYLQQRLWDEATERYLAAITIKPELLPAVRPRVVAAKLNVLPTLAENGDFAAMEESAREGLEVDPTSEPLRYYYGLAQEGQGNARAAAEEYLLVCGGRRPGNMKRAVAELRLRAEKKLLEANQVRPTAHPQSDEVLPGDFRTAESRRFKIRHKNRKIAAEVDSVAERAYREIFRRLGCSTHLRTKILVTVYPTRQDYLRGSSQTASWSTGSHRIQRRMGVLSEHAISCYQNQPRLLTETIPHEVGHSLFTHRLNYPPEIPLWANEGFAILVEPTYSHRFYHRRVGQALVGKELIPFSELTSRRKYPDQNVHLFYGQSHSLVEFLVSEKGLETFVKFVLSISKSGLKFDAALKRHYGLEGLRALENRWRAWFERRVMQRG